MSFEHFQHGSMPEVEVNNRWPVSPIADGITWMHAIDTFRQDLPAVLRPVADHAYTSARDYVGHQLDRTLAPVVSDYTPFRMREDLALAGGSREDLQAAARFEELVPALYRYTDAIEAPDELKFSRAQRVVARMALLQLARGGDPAAYDLALRESVLQKPKEKPVRPRGVPASAAMAATFLIKLY